MAMVQSGWMPRWPSAPAWDPDEADEQAYLATIEEYMAQVRARPEYAIARMNPNAARDLEWLVRYQVNEEPYRSIAQGLPAAARERPETTTRNAVLRVASVIGLTLRAPNRTGRPQKVRTSHPGL